MKGRLKDKLKGRLIRVDETKTYEFKSSLGKVFIYKSLENGNEYDIAITKKIDNEETEIEIGAEYETIINEFDEALRNGEIEK